MKRFYVVAAAGLLLLCSRVVGQDVRYNFDKNSDFSKFRTYKWVPLKDSPTVNDLVNKQIIDAIDVELSAKGLTKVEDESADLYIGYQVAIGQEKQFTSFSSDWGYGGGWYRGGWYRPGSTATTGTTSTIYVGQLAVDMYQQANHSLVWRGLVSKTIDPTAKPEKQQKNLVKAVKKMMKNYPPPHK